MLPYIPIATATGAASGIRVLGAKLGDDPGWRGYDADFAKSSLSLRVAAITGNIRHSGKLPDIRTLTAVHFEGAGRWPKLEHERIDILSDEFVAEPSDDLLTRRGAAPEGSEQRQDSENTPFAEPPSRRHPSSTGGRRQVAGAEFSGPSLVSISASCTLQPHWFH